MPHPFRPPCSNVGFRRLLCQACLVQTGLQKTVRVTEIDVCDCTKITGR
uniref:Uncharacterized protein n=1 Tax=Anguilla anguilla TaxID=7936 RepID=A0A0E9TNJ1_ANGAN